ncbi:hypothetical protein [Duganella violaceipulchra]|uniref:Uncharacterized protein n=1 Tax=Duganella violaceipulchra TaxID=2849652 RepID=A0AA41L5N6_9BURK|nr:hypothetical protein [Duganella violaceicalia]MBV6324384.1 hypothetical protein [Duganella violaceicalia]MCP2011986.1 hypothetical protein [Duganella violaceicalia]
MPNHIEAAYIPLATKRTKNVIKHLQPGSRQTIDAVSAQDPSDRAEVEIWTAEHDDGVHTFYQDGPNGDVKYLGFADNVRVAIEEAATEE